MGVVPIDLVPEVPEQERQDYRMLPNQSPEKGRIVAGVRVPSEGPTSDWSASGFLWAATARG